jgi:type IV secretory pathway VirB2 component (pilin)
MKDASFMVAVVVVAVVSAMLVFCDLIFARGCCAVCGRLAIVSARE